jgi:hypothetical protein
MSLKLTSLLVLATASQVNGQSVQFTCNGNNPAVSLFSNSNDCSGDSELVPLSATGCAVNPANSAESAVFVCTPDPVMMTYSDNPSCDGTGGTPASVPANGCIDLSGPAPEDNKVKCPFKIGGAEFKCEWYQECYEQKDVADSTNDMLENTLNGCILKGNKVCARYEEYGENGKVVANSLANGGCHPSTTCCDGACCTENQECLPIETGTFAYGAYDKTTGQQKYPDVDAHNSARMGWTVDNGDALTARPMKCVDIKFDATTGGKAVFGPMMAMLLLLGAAVSGFLRSKTGFLDKIAPAFIMLSGFFLMLTEGWVFALFTALVAAATMAAPRDGFKGGCLVLGQLLFCWIYFGGNSYLFVQKGDMKNYFSEAAGNGMTALENSCATFYDFYRFTAQTKPWNVGDTRSTFGLCSKEFIGFQVIMAYVNAFALFTMTTHTLMDYLATVGGASTKATNVANPAAGADNA